MQELEKTRVAEIIGLHNEICGLLETSLDKAIRIGQLLNEQKGALGHGAWLPWVRANLPFTERTAQNYMRLYEQRELLKNENVSHLAEGYKLLQGPNKPTKPESLYQQVFDLQVRRISLERDAGAAMNEINRLLTPAAGYSIVGIADENIVFHIEGGDLIVFVLKPEHGFTERRYSTGGDLWWYLNKHVGMGNIGAIWPQAEIEITPADLERFGKPTDMDGLWDIAGQIVQERIPKQSEDEFIQVASRLYHALMSAYARLCEAWGHLKGTAQAAEVTA